MNDMLDLELSTASEDILWKACTPVSVKANKGIVEVELPFQAQQKKAFLPDLNIPRKNYTLYISAYGASIIRTTVSFGSPCIDDENNPMLEMDASLKLEELTAIKTDTGWDICDSKGRNRMRINTKVRETRQWTEWAETIDDTFEAIVYPDGNVAVPFMSRDTFFPTHMESVGLGYIERASVPNRCMFSLHAKNNEKFAGTGERFSKMDLSGQTFALENADALGVNSRRAYKNIPFYVSSRPYGLLMMTSAHTRLSLADISTRAAQAVLEDDVLDLFFIGGGSVEAIVHNYRKITGFPKQVPLWTYGTWMSRMTYFSAEETKGIARKLREEKFPCDVIHLDTGWFKKDWKCEWEFSPERFPDPDKYMQQMKDMGFRVSLWQLPLIAQDTAHYEEAKTKGYLPPKSASKESGSNFGDVEYGGNIDFSNPEAVVWYQGLLKKLLDIGASAIKTDFGEEIYAECNYHGMPYSKLHNLYGVLYQKAAYEVTKEATGEGVIWARAGWTGSQRYPIHWGGDCACSWDGLAGSIRGGLHIGLSGFAFWSHDVSGFHGVPAVMSCWPEDDLYVRWTQCAIFGSHLRYHGTTPREPYEYPNAAPIVRQWLNLRYAIIPYIYEQGNKAENSGYPVLRAMIFHHEEDPFCWHIDDQFYCGDNLLVAPIINSEGVRDVYLPKGAWTDIWTGEVLQGPVLLKDIKCPLERIPVYARTNSSIKVYPESIQCTDEMDLNKAVHLVFDETYTGLSNSILGNYINI